MRVADEIAELARLGAGRSAEKQVGAVEPEHRELVAKERAVPAMLDQTNVAEVAADVSGLQLPVQSVDERLHLLVDPRGDDSAGRLHLERRAGDHAFERRDEPGRNGEHGDDLPGAQLPLRLVMTEPDEADVLAHAPDRPVDVEEVAADADETGQPILVHERNPRLRVRVPGNKADEQGDQERVGKE